MREHIADFIEKNQFEPADQMEPTFVVDVDDLRNFLSGFTLIEGPFRIEDKEPEVDQTVLAFNGRTWEQCYYDQDAFLLDDGNHEPVFEDVTHWMPMPDPIKE